MRVGQNGEDGDAVGQAGHVAGLPERPVRRLHRRKRPDRHAEERRTAPATSPDPPRRTAGCGMRCRHRRRRSDRRSVARPARRRRCRGRRPPSGPPPAGRAASGSSGPENMASIRRPVRSGPSSSPSAVARSTHQAAVRRSCHPRTGPSGSPVLRRHATTDSRWLEMVTPARAAVRSGASRQAATAASTLAQISSASCSTHPGRGDEMPTRGGTVSDDLPGLVDQDGLGVGRSLIDRQDHGRLLGFETFQSRSTGLDVRCNCDTLCGIE